MLVRIPRGVRDVATGGLKWTFAGDGQLSYPPAIADGYVYVSSDENLYAVDVSTHLPSIKNPLEGGCWRVVDRGSHRVIVAPKSKPLTEYVLSK